MDLDPELLLKPIDDAQPTGRDLRSAGDDAALYYRLKETRFGARARERQADAEAEGAVQPPEWKVLFDGAISLLQTKTKDLEIATWLIEAALRLRGFAGLAFSIRVLDGLIARYWDTLHSIDSETPAEKAAPIAGLNGVDAEGALIQPIRLAPLSTGGTPPAGLWLWQQAQRGGAESAAAKLLAEAVKSTPRDRFVALSRDLESAWSAFRQLSGRLDEVCGSEAPPLSTIRTVLEEAREALRQISGVEPELERVEPVAAEEPAADDDAADTRTAAAPVAAADPRRLETRDDALRELGRIAAFFREREPSSPISYALETLIRRARLPLADLLRELIPDEAVRKSALAMAGIAPDAASGA